MMTVCPTCGSPFEPFDSGAECRECRPKDDGKLEQIRGTRQARGYDYRWIKLSRKARQLQPFCSDCGTTDDLTADHSTEAWARRAAGKSIRLQDIDVVCRRCNTDRGAARGAGASDEYRAGSSGVEFLP